MMKREVKKYGDDTIPSVGLTISLIGSRIDSPVLLRMLSSSLTGITGGFASCP